MRRTDHPPANRPVLVYDGECAFCRRWVARLSRATGERVEYAALQTDARRFPDVPRAEFERAVQLIEESGAMWAGAAAALKTLSRAPGLGWIFAIYRIPGAAAVLEWIYGEVSRRRRGL